MCVHVSLSSTPMQPGSGFKALAPVIGGQSVHASRLLFHSGRNSRHPLSRKRSSQNTLSFSIKISWPHSFTRHFPLLHSSEDSSSLQLNSTTFTLFSNPLLPFYKRDRNMPDILVHCTLPLQTLSPLFPSPAPNPAVTLPRSFPTQPTKLGPNTITFLALLPALSTVLNVIYALNCILASQSQAYRPVRRAFTAYPFTK